MLITTRRKSRSVPFCLYSFWIGGMLLNLSIGRHIGFVSGIHNNDNASWHSKYWLWNIFLMLHRFGPGHNQTLHKVDLISQILVNSPFICSNISKGSIFKRPKPWLFSLSQRSWWGFFLIPRPFQDFLNYFFLF